MQPVFGMYNLPEVNVRKNYDDDDDGVGDDDSVGDDDDGGDGGSDDWP